MEKAKIKIKVFHVIPGMIFDKFSYFRHQCRENINSFIFLRNRARKTVCQIIATVFPIPSTCSNISKPSNRLNLKEKVHLLLICRSTLLPERTLKFCYWNKQWWYYRIICDRIKITLAINQALLSTALIRTKILP